MSRKQLHIAAGHRLSINNCIQTRTVSKPPAIYFVSSVVRARGLQMRSVFYCSVPCLFTAWKCWTVVTVPVAFTQLLLVVEEVVLVAPCSWTCGQFQEVHARGIRKVQVSYYCSHTLLQLWTDTHVESGLNVVCVLACVILNAKWSSVAILVLHFDIGCMVYRGQCWRSVLMPRALHWSKNAFWLTEFSHSLELVQADVNIFLCS